MNVYPRCQPLFFTKNQQYKKKEQTVHFSMILHTFQNLEVTGKTKEIPNYKTLIKIYTIACSNQKNQRLLTITQVHLRPTLKP